MINAARPAVFPNYPEVSRSFGRAFADSIHALPLEEREAVIQRACRVVVGQREDRRVPHDPRTGLVAAIPAVSSASFAHPAFRRD
jgi:hypothetical protein